MAFVDYYKKSPLELLDHDEFRAMPTAVDPYWSSTVCAATGYFTGLVVNKTKGRPIHAGLHYIALASAVGWFIGLKIDDYFRARSKKRWAIVRNYVELHPEDFPPYPPRIKFANTLQPWVPCRPGS